MRRPNAPDERGWVNGDHAVWCRIGELSGVDGDLGVTSIYLQGIDSHEIISTVHARPAPVIPATAGLRNRR